MRAALVLAAGASHRFGRADKLAQRVGGVRLLDRVLANALAAVPGRVLLVAPRARQVSRVTLVRSSRGQPMATSLAAGLAALRPIEREILIFLGDMPFAHPPRMRLGRDQAVRPIFAGVPGHPLLVRTAAARAALGAGDAGLASRLRPATVRGRPGNIFDIDTRLALRRARLHGSGSFRPRS